MTAPSPSPLRAVPVNAERGARRRVMGATDWWFYPLVLMGAAALIVMSLGIDVFDTTAAPQRATRDGAALVYGPHEIARGARTDADHVRFVVRDLGVSARGVRFAVRPSTPAPDADDTGVQLLLDPADAAALAGKTVDVELQLQRFSISAAGGIALSLQNGGPVQWVTAPLPPASGPLVVRVAAPEGAPPSALGLRLLTDETNMNYGVEFTRIALRPAP